MPALCGGSKTVQRKLVLLCVSIELGRGIFALIDVLGVMVLAERLRC